MSQEMGLKLWNVLEDLDTLVEDGQDLGYNVLWVSGVHWNEMIWLEDKIKDKEWLWVLILIEHFVKQLHGGL